MTDCTIHFMPADVQVKARTGDNLLQIAVEAGVHIHASCGGDGACGKCRVLIKSGTVESTECANLPPDDYAQGWRLACRTKIKSNVEVLVPAHAPLQAEAVRKARIHAHEARHAAASAAAVRWFDPPVHVYTLQLAPPTLADNAADFTRLQRTLRKDHGIDVEDIELDALKSLPHAARAGAWQVSISICDRRIIRVEPGAASAARFAVAFDIGTTSLWGHLVDVNTGSLLAEASAYNPQISCGDDVISRIIYSQKPGGLAHVQKVLAHEISRLIDELAQKSAILKADISHIAAAGNTVMSHLLLGIDPKYLREAPYVPAASLVPLVCAADIGLAVHRSVPLLLLPCVASYVGGDIVAGVVACGMHETDLLTLYIDIGTNGEIVLGNRDWLMTASCSAGPSFEGGGLSCGMRAMPGAIEGFSICEADFEPMIVTIGRQRPVGICGSGAINILDEFMETGIIARNGKFNRDLSALRIRQGAGGFEYVLVEGSLSGTGADIVITEADIDNIMRAKAAMFAGCHALLANAGLTFSDLDQVIIAGAFGEYIDLEKAVAIGLFPDIPRERYTFIGNGSLSGARLAAGSRRYLETAKDVARKMTNIELSEDQSFMDKYIAGLFLPHTDSTLFPTVTVRLEKTGKGAL